MTSTSHQFWHVNSPESGTKLAEWAEEVDLDSVHCSANSGHQRAGKRITDLSVILPNAPVEDVVWTWYSECLVQDHILRLFQRYQLTGYEVKPVQARFKRPSGDSPPTLWELVVTGWAGMAAPDSGVKQIEYCPACRLRSYSPYTDASRLIDSRQWDGSDLFMVWPLPRYIFVSDRVVEILRNHTVSGIRIQALRDLKAKHTLGGGRLSYWMPEARAKELGGPLDIE
ncbi:MAG: hypothetical protein KF722_03010 [Nitrospira sp.]|nr:hypothetical protein [Nitrospira sp.]